MDHINNIAIFFRDLEARHSIGGDSLHGKFKENLFPCLRKEISFPPLNSKLSSSMCKIEIANNGGKAKITITMTIHLLNMNSTLDNSFELPRSIGTENEIRFFKI